jgi:hypothetical protein
MRFQENLFMLWIALFVRYYNQYRPHQALNGQTPAQVWDDAQRLQRHRRDSS